MEESQYIRDIAMTVAKQIKQNTTNPMMQEMPIELVADTIYNKIYEEVDTHVIAPLKQLMFEINEERTAVGKAKL